MSRRHRLDRRPEADVIYREAGQFKTTYASDQAIFPIVQDKWLVAAGIVAAVVAGAPLGEEELGAGPVVPLPFFSLGGPRPHLFSGVPGGALPRPPGVFSP